MLDLPLIASRLYDTPLLLARPKLETICAALSARIAAGEPLTRLEAPPQASFPPADAETPQGRPVYDGGVALIPVVGSTVRRGGYLDAMSGVTSYAAVEHAIVQAAADPGVSALLLDLDTPGGEAGGVFDLAETIRSVAAASGKPIWAIANEAALSAGYAIACGCDRIWTTRTGEVGSIGVVAAHLDVSRADRAAGLAYTFIYAGDRKIDGNPHQPLAPEALASVEADIRSLYAMFVEEVSRARGMSASAVRATEARIYRGADAVSAGLADEVGTLSDALAALGQMRLRPGRAGRRGGAAASTQPHEVSMTRTAKLAAGRDDTAADDMPEAKAAAAAKDYDEKDAKAGDDADEKDAKAGDDADEKDAKAEPKGRSRAKKAEDDADEKDAKADAAAQERDRAAEIIRIAEQASAAGVQVDASTAIADGVSADALRQRVLEAISSRPRAPAASTTAAPEAAASAWTGVLAKIGALRN